ncbi:hypothetical protein [Bacillus sp. FJAT-28004]|uniref:hypothetical protein n=1 Tax=Bacillus sp. FJAT-28004 TaxID=1679165 RepID=UPI0006B5CD55|nr:hypothetical protein [Bacillus sp. FJAT-28004]
MMIEHISPDQMFRYVNDRLIEAERVPVEQHLAACDFCLQLFITAIETAEGDLQPADTHLTNVRLTPIPDMERLEKRVVEQLRDEQEQYHIDAKQHVAPNTLQEKPRRLRTWLQHPVTHYTIAASITLLLLASGTFASFSQKLAQLDMNENAQQDISPNPPVSASEHTESWSDRIVDQTGSWLDGLKASRFR